jgi:hypothetical protein
MPGNHSKEMIQHSQHGETLKSRIIFSFYSPYWKKLLEVVAFSVQMHITPNRYIVHCVLKVLLVKLKAAS